MELSQEHRHRVLATIGTVQSLAATAAAPTDLDALDELEVVFTGTLEQAHAQSVTLASEWRLASFVRAGESQAGLHALLPRLRLLRESGIVVTAVFDTESMPTAASNLVLAEDQPNYHLTYAPLSLTIGDGRSVLLVREAVDGDWALLRLTSPAVVSAALDYWNAVTHAEDPPGAAAVTAACADPGRTPAGPDLTERQLAILQLLSAGLTDDHIAHRLEVSVRTVRADVRAAMDQMGATSRFEAGCAFAGLDPAVG